jgi:organic radical activating enzyme
MSKLKVVDIFSSLQGEGTRVGTPVVFIRLYGCNLECVWCDTKEAWDTELTSNNYEEMGIKDIVEYVHRSGLDTVVVTGGEPLARDQEKLVELSEQLFDMGITTEVETNGSIVPKMGHLFDRYNISPKLSSSGNELYFDKVEEFMEKTLYAKKQLKFVVAGKEDMEEVIEFLGRKKVKGLMKFVNNDVDTENNIVDIVLQPEYNSLDMRQLYQLYDYYRRKVAMLREYPYNNIRIIPQTHKTADLK